VVCARLSRAGATGHHALERGWLNRGVLSPEVSLTSFIVGLLMSMSGLALLYGRELPNRVAGGLLAAAGVVFVFASPADPMASIVLLILVLVLASFIFGTQWLGRARASSAKDNGQV
jgi:hypothetical protein